MPIVYDLPCEIWKHVLLYVRARDVCAFRTVDRYAARFIAPFVPHASGPRFHCSRHRHGIVTGHEEAFVWMIEHREETYDFSACFNAASARGCLNILDILERRGLRNSSSKTMDYAAMNGHLNVVQWLHENRKSQVEGCSTDAMDGAAMNGHLEVVKWLRANLREG